MGDKDEDEDDCYDEASSVDQCFHTVKHPDLHRSSKVCTTASALLHSGLQINQSNPSIDPPLWEGPVGLWEGALGMWEGPMTTMSYFIF